MYKLYADNISDCVVSEGFWNIVHYVNMHYSLDSILFHHVEIRIFVHSGIPDLYTTLDSVIVHNIVSEIRDILHAMQRDW